MSYQSTLLIGNFVELTQELSKPLIPPCRASCYNGEPLRWGDSAVVLATQEPWAATGT
jgi:hypothetical protein